MLLLALVVKKYYESKGSDICDHWMKLSSTKLYENKTYGMIQPSLPCPTKGPMNAVVSLHKVQYPELSYSLEITGDYLATQNGHLFKGTLIMLIPILVLSLIQIIGLFVQQYINIAILECIHDDLATKRRRGISLIREWKKILYLQAIYNLEYKNRILHNNFNFLYIYRSIYKLKYLSLA